MIPEHELKAIEALGQNCAPNIPRLVAHIREVEAQLADLRVRAEEARVLLDGGDAYGADATLAMILLGDSKCFHGVNLGRKCHKCAEGKEASNP